MVSKDFTIVNKQGLQMRPVQDFVKAMMKYSSEITIKFNGKDVNGKSIMLIMAACIKYGAQITVVCNGADEEAMLAEAAAMIESGFGED